VTVATACNRENSSPTIAPANNPNQGVAAPKVSANVRLKTTDANAPIPMIPSKPTLTTPARSENVPPIEVKINGAE